MTCTTRCYSHVLVNVLVNIHAYSVVLVSLNVLVRTTFPHLYYTRLQKLIQSPFSFAEESDFHFASVRSVEAGRTARAERQVRPGRTEARPTAMRRGFMGVERSSVTLNLWETAC